MDLRRVIEKPPGEHPGDPEKAGAEKYRAPRSKVMIEPQNENGHQCAANCGTAIKYCNCPAALGFWEPLRNGLCRARPIGRFARTHEESEDHKAPQPHCKARQHG